MSKTVSKRSGELSAMVEATTKGRALMGRTKAMRAAGETYLPKFKAEAPEDYTARLNSSWLFNGFRKTTMDMTGRVFSKPIEIAEGPAQLIEWADNIDMAGRDLSTFAAEVFKDGFQSGVAYIMADAPRFEGQATQQQAKDLGLRPMLSHLRVEDVLGFQTQNYGNVLALSQFRIMEAVTEQDPKDEFAQVTVDQVRVLDRLDDGVFVRLYRKNDKGEWLVFDEYKTAAKEITVVPYYAARTGFFTGEPVLEDLADVNIAHWVSQSDQRNILHFARVPILHASGRNSDEKLTISAGTAIQSDDPNAKIEWVEHSGNAIGAGRQDLKDLEFQMEALGLQLVVARVGNAGATGAALDAAKETSTLAMMADSLKDALEQALQFMAYYGGLGKKTITVAVNKEFGITMITPQELQVMQADVALGLLSKETYMEERKRRGVLRSDLDTSQEMDRINEEAPTLKGDPMDLGGGASDAVLAGLNG